MTPADGTSRPGDGLRRLVIHEVALLTRHRRAIVANVSIVVVFAFVVSLTVGDQYTAHTSVLPPPPPSGEIEQFARQLPLALGPGGVITVMDEVEQVAQSRRIGDAVIERNDLRSVYNEKMPERAYWRMRDRLDVRLDAARILHLSFRDESPERAAAVLSSLVDELNIFYTEARRSRGRLLAELIRARVDSTELRRIEAELALGAYRSENRAAYPSRTAARELSLITARGIMLEIELEALSRYTRAPMPLITQRETELASITKELRRHPDVALEELRLRRDLAVQQELLDLLTGQLTAARALEAREVPFLEVLDGPVPPAVRTWPGHAKIVIASLVISLASAALLAHLVDFVESNRAPLAELFRSRGRSPARPT